MSRKLEDLLNLPPAKEMADDPEISAEDAEEELEEARTTLAAVDDAMSKIDIALPTVRDLDASDKEMDDIATLATDSFKDLLDLAMNVEARFSGPILQSASSLLGHAVTAKMAKMDKKLKMVDLQLKKARLDQQAEKAASAGNGTADAPIEGEGVVIDRNDLIKQILAQSTKNDK